MKFRLMLSAVCMLTASLCFVSCYQEAKAKGEPSVKSQNSLSPDLVWHEIDEIEKILENDPKPVIVDVYTDWCKWCKVMDQKTFSEPMLKDHLKNNFHLVKFNAETKKDINFLGKTYSYLDIGRRGYNQLAPALVDGSLSYPSFVILNENLETKQVIKGFKDAIAFKELITKAMKS